MNAIEEFIKGFVLTMFLLVMGVFIPYFISSKSIIVGGVLPFIAIVVSFYLTRKNRR